MARTRARSTAAMASVTRSAAEASSVGAASVESSLESSSKVEASVVSPATVCSAETARVRGLRRRRSRDGPVRDARSAPPTGSGAHGSRRSTICLSRSALRRTRSTKALSVRASALSSSSTGPTGSRSPPDSWLSDSAARRMRVTGRNDTSPGARRPPRWPRAPARAGHQRAVDRPRGSGRRPRRCARPRPGTCRRSCRRARPRPCTRRRLPPHAARRPPGCDVEGFVQVARHGVHQGAPVRGLDARRARPADGSSGVSSGFVVRSATNALRSLVAKVTSLSG